jgi:hypothetical protein
MNGSTAFSTCASGSCASNAPGAGSSPFWSRIAAAWRAASFALCPGPLHSFRVEAGLEVLEGDGEVDDVDIAAAARRLLLFT